MGIHSSPHKLIMSSRVVGAPVFNREGERIGEVEDLSIEKVSGRTDYAIISFGGFLGMGEQLHPLPWSMLEYDTDKGGYVVSLDKQQLKDAPSLTRAELEELGAGDTWRTRIFDYYGPYGGVPYV